MAMLADKNKRSSSKDDGQTGSAEFYKDFVSVYFEILNGENEMSAEQDIASKAIFETIGVRAQISRGGRRKFCPTETEIARLLI